MGLYRFLSVCVFIAGALVISRPDQLFPASLGPPSPLHQHLSRQDMYADPLTFSANTLPPSDGQLDLAGVLACVASVVITSLLFILNRSVDSVV